jgi:hypothetical protein
VVYGKKCSDNHGYWSNDEAVTNYAGCEHFCNQKFGEGKKIVGCELTKVPSATRTSRGFFCLAHLSECSLGERTRNAAAKCEEYGSGMDDAAGLAQSTVRSRNNHHNRRHNRTSA